MGGTLEQSTKTLWLYQRNLAEALETGPQSLVDSRLDDLAMTANFSEHQSVRAAAVKSLYDYESTVTANRKSRKRRTTHKVVQFGKAATA